MKGVVLAGGLGTRLLPLTKHTNKHLLPVGEKPMIEWSLEKLDAAGIEDVLIVSSPDGVEQIRPVIGARASYIAQPSPLGVADAIAWAGEFAAGQPIVVLLGDNLFEAGLTGPLSTWAASDRDAMVLLKRVDDPARYGIARLEQGQVVEIVEKPTSPSGDLAVTGIYFYPGDFAQRIARLKPSSRGELEVSALNQAYLEEGRLKHAMLEGFWIDAGTLEDYERAERWFRSRRS